MKKICLIAFLVSIILSHAQFQKEDLEKEIKIEFGNNKNSYAVVTITNNEDYFVIGSGKVNYYKRKNEIEFNDSYFKLNDILIPYIKIVAIKRRSKIKIDGYDRNFDYIIYLDSNKL